MKKKKKLTKIFKSLLIILKIDNFFFVYGIEIYLMNYVLMLNQLQ